MVLHECGHIPSKIKLRKLFGIIPYSADAMSARSRIGGLVVNVILFSYVFYAKPEVLILQYIGLIAWIHFILYSIFGSLIPEPREQDVDIRTYVFDDVDNGKAVYFIGGAILVFLIMKSYYLGMISW